MKKEPPWRYAIPVDFIVAAGTGKTAEQAQQAALTQVKQIIVGQIASVVMSDETLSTSATDTDGRFTRTDNYNATVRLSSAYSGFLNGISISKVEQYYWKKVKKKKEITYHYVIQYPFKQTVLDSLIKDWNVRQAGFRERLGKLEAKPDSSYRTFEEICRDYEEARLLSETMVDRHDVNRAAFIASIRSQWLNSAIVDVRQTSVNNISCRLLISGKAMDTENPPSLEKTCLSLVSVNKKNLEYSVLCRRDNCDCRVDNSVTVVFSFSGFSVSGTIPFDLSSVCVGFEPYGTFVSEIKKATSGILGFGGTFTRSYRIQFRALYKGPFKINRIDYSYTRKGMFGSKEFRGTLEGLNAESRGKSVIPVHITRPLNDLEKEESAGDYNAVVTIYYTDLSTKSEKKAIFENVPFKVLK